MIVSAAFNLFSSTLQMLLQFTAIPNFPPTLPSAVRRGVPAGEPILLVTAEHVQPAGGSGRADRGLH